LTEAAKPDVSGAGFRVRTLLVVGVVDDAGEVQSRDNNGCCLSSVVENTEEHL
jgi:hypothetical protein